MLLLEKNQNDAESVPIAETTKSMDVTPVTFTAVSPSLTLSTNVVNPTTSSQVSSTVSVKGNTSSSSIASVPISKESQNKKENKQKEKAGNQRATLSLSNMQ